MRHRIAGRTLGRNASHRRAMFRNMAASMIKTVQIKEGEVGQPVVAGRIVTTVEKAKELRPYVEKLITLARKALVTDAAAEQFATSAPRNSAEWKAWRESNTWQQWAQARAPGVAARRKAFALLRDDDAVKILFSDLAVRFQSRPGGYTRILKVSTRRLGDSGFQAIIEFVGQNDRASKKDRKRSAPKSIPVVQPAAANG